MTRRRKLNDAQVQEIREWYRLVKSTPSVAELQAKYKVTATVIYMVGRGLRYKTVHPADRHG